MVTRLPFAVPSDPIYAARTRVCSTTRSPVRGAAGGAAAEAGIRPAHSLAVAAALCVLDRRLITRSYCEVFVRSLPPCSVKQGPGPGAAAAKRPSWLAIERPPAARQLTLRRSRINGGGATCAADNLIAASRTGWAAASVRASLACSVAEGCRAARGRRSCLEHHADGQVDRVALAFAPRVRRCRRGPRRARPASPHSRQPRRAAVVDAGPRQRERSSNAAASPPCASTEYPQRGAGAARCERALDVGAAAGAARRERHHQRGQLQHERLELGRAMPFSVSSASATSSALPRRDPGAATCRSPRPPSDARRRCRCRPSPAPWPGRWSTSAPPPGVGWRPW